MGVPGSSTLLTGCTPIFSAHVRNAIQNLRERIDASFTGWDRFANWLKFVDVVRQTTADWVGWESLQCAADSNPCLPDKLFRNEYPSSSLGVSEGERAGTDIGRRHEHQ